MRLLHQFAAGFLKPQPSCCNLHESILEVTVVGRIKDHLAQEDALPPSRASLALSRGSQSRIIANAAASGASVLLKMTRVDACVRVPWRWKMILLVTSTPSMWSIRICSVFEERQQNSSSLGASPRQWAMQPEDMAARTLVLRALPQGQCAFGWAMRLVRWPTALSRR